MEATKTRVLVVEDEPSIAEWLEPALKWAGDLEVRVITNGFDQLLQPEIWESVDVVLTDWMLPHFETERMLEYLEKEQPHIRRVIFTAANHVNAKAHCVLHKPASLNEITQAITGNL